MGLNGLDGGGEVFRDGGGRRFLGVFHRVRSLEHFGIQSDGSGFLCRVGWLGLRGVRVGYFRVRGIG